MDTMANQSVKTEAQETYLESIVKRIDVNEGQLILLYEKLYDLNKKLCGEAPEASSQVSSEPDGLLGLISNKIDHQDHTIQECLRIVENLKYNL